MSPLLIAVVVDVFTELARVGALRSVKSVTVCL